MFVFWRLINGKGLRFFTSGRRGKTNYIFYLVFGLNLVFYFVGEAINRKIRNAFLVD